jgi:hypothetical protein
MCSRDVTEVYSQIQIGQLVRIIPDSLPKLPKYKGEPAAPASPDNPSRVIFTAGAPNGVPATSAKRATAAGKSKPVRKRVSIASNTAGPGA